MTHGDGSPFPASDGVPSAQGWLEGAAGRWLHAGQLESNPDLVALGWQRRFVTDGGRTAEVVALYEQLGFEIHLEPLVAADVPEGCTDCQLVALFHFQTVYTRRPPPIRGQGGE